MVSKDRVKQFRLQHGWSQEQLASITGMSTRTVQRIEKSGDCSLESQMALSSAFGISPDELSQDISNKINESNKNLSGVFYIGILTLVLGSIYIFGGSLQILIHQQIIAIFVLAFLAMSFMANGSENTFMIITLLKRFVFGVGKLTNPQLFVRTIRRQIIHSYASGGVACLLSSLFLFSSSNDGNNLYLKLTLYAVISLLYSVVLSELLLRPTKQRLEAELLEPAI
jgi:transcriptional regulator with XRE-family HTH domain